MDVIWKYFHQDEDIQGSKLVGEGYTVTIFMLNIFNISYIILQTFITKNAIRPSAKYAINMFSLVCCQMLCK